MIEEGYTLFNFIVMCAKYYIYCCKSRSTIPTLNSFKSILKQRKQIEKIIALRTDTFSRYNEKWSKLPSLDVD